MGKMSPRIKPTVPTSVALNTIIKTVCAFCNANHLSLECNETTAGYRCYENGTDGTEKA